MWTGKKPIRCEEKHTFVSVLFLVVNNEIKPGLVSWVEYEPVCVVYGLTLPLPWRGMVDESRQEMANRVARYKTD